MYYIKDYNYEPEYFCANDGNYYVFFNNKKEIVGCANIIFNKIKDILYVEIKYIEAYGEGKGKNIINYILNLNDNVFLYGESYEDTKGFWKKMGAKFEEKDDDLIPFTIEKGCV